MSYRGEKGEGEFLPHVKGDTLGYEWKGGPLEEVFQQKPRRINLGDDLGHDPPRAVIPTSEMAEIILRNPRTPGMRLTIMQSSPVADQARTALDGSRLRARPHRGHVRRRRRA